MKIIFQQTSCIVNIDVIFVYLVFQCKNSHAPIYAWGLFSEPEQEYSINIEVNNKKEIKINLFIGRHNMNFLSVNYDILTCNSLACLQSSKAKIDQTIFGRHNTEETVFVHRYNHAPHFLREFPLCCRKTFQHFVYYLNCIRHTNIS